jgi:hypothetical protein
MSCNAVTNKGKKCKNLAKVLGKCNKHKIITFKFNVLPMEIKLMIINYLDYVSFTEFIKIENNFDFCFNLINNEVENKKFIFYKKLDYLEINSICNTHFIRPFCDKILNKRKNYIDSLNEIVLSNKNEKQTFIYREFVENYLRVLRIYNLNINIFINIVYWLEYNFKNTSYISLCAAFHILIKSYKYNFPHHDTIYIQQNLYNEHYGVISTDELAEKINKMIVIILFNLYKDGIMFD